MNSEGINKEKRAPSEEDVTVTDKEKNLLMPYEFDGIRELDNPPPKWLMYVLYVTIFFSALYWVHYHTFKQGPTQDEEYLAEKAASDAARGADTSVAQVAQLTDQANLDAGRKIFNEKLCYSCHGMAGEGNAVGPNLTDDYWIHGSTIEKIVEVLINGVPAKGMAPFKDQLTKEQILQVASYVLSLRGTNPPNAKAPQGEKAG